MFFGYSGQQQNAFKKEIKKENIRARYKRRDDQMSTLHKRLHSASPEYILGL